MVVALIRPSLMTKWRVGTTPLRPKPTNTPRNRQENSVDHREKHETAYEGRHLSFIHFWNAKLKLNLTCSDTSVLWSSKKVTLWNGDGSQTQDTHNYQVDEAGLRRAVERIVQPGDEGAHDQEGNPTVVQSEHNISQLVRVFYFHCHKKKTVVCLTWKRLWTHPPSDSRLCGKARRRRGRGWLRGKTSQLLPSLGVEPQKTCWVWTCTWDPGRGRTNSLQEGGERNSNGKSENKRNES